MIPPASSDPPPSNPLPVANSGQKLILGLDTEEITSFSLEELTGNTTAIKMLVHYYKVLQDENGTLRNDLNTTRSYVTAYQGKKKSTNIAAILAALSNVGIGFGINLLTSEKVWPGIATIIPGIAMAATSLYLSFKED